MSERPPSLGKLIAVHGTSPHYAQRAAIVTALSSFFFLLTLGFFLIWQTFLYFFLAAAFLVVSLLTLMGWWMQKRNAVSIYSNGLSYRKRPIAWAEITAVSKQPDSGLAIDLTNGDALKFPASIQGLDRIEGFIRTKVEVPPSGDGSPHRNVMTQREAG